MLSLIEPFSPFFKWSDSIWAQQNSQAPHSLSLLGLPAFYVDFKQSQALSATLMNRWIEHSSADHISGFINPTLNTNKLLLKQITTAYFSNQWLFPFPTSHTKLGLFKRRQGKQEPVLMMSQKHYFPFYKGNNFSMVILPYKHASFSLLLILPNETGKTIKWLSQLTPKKLHSYLVLSRYTMVDLVLPKIQLHSTLSSIQFPHRLLSEHPTSDSVNLDASLCTSNNMSHAVGFSLAFTESGTSEKETVSAKPIGQTALSENIVIPFHADKPFAFLLIEQKTESILMLGAVRSSIAVATTADNSYTSAEQTISR